MAVETRTTSSPRFSSTIATRRKCLTLEEAPSTIEVPVRRALPSRRKVMFLALFTMALMAVITGIRFGFLQDVRGEPYYTSILLLSRITSTTSDSINTADATTSGSSSNLAAAVAYDGPSRVWEPFNGGNFPCYPGERHLMSTEPAHRGFLFHRPHKVGSTTMVGILLRLVHNKAAQQQQQFQDNMPNNQKGAGSLKCLHRANHGSTLAFEYNQRDIAHSFLFSLLRHPTQRAISEFFHFRVATYGQEPTDQNFIKFLRRKGMRNYYLQDMTMKAFDNNNSTDSYGPQVTPLTTIVQDILDSFDFMAITERMNESLVVMQMLLGLETKDIVYTRARTSGTFSNGPPERPCNYIMPSFLTPGMKDFFASQEWLNITRGDLLLYQAASASLDRTIEALGRKEFENKLQALERGLALVEENCKDEGRIVTLCTEGGQRLAPQNTTCYIWSEGCDHDCIDELGDI